jgi:CheY-like chemotaxis protein
MENKNILVVEDDNATRDTMIDLLSEAGYEVESARNGEEAIAMAREYTFDIVITRFWSRLRKLIIEQLLLFVPDMEQ